MNSRKLQRESSRYFEPSSSDPIEQWTKIELGNNAEPQLYNVEVDPSEKNNLSIENPNKTMELAKSLDSIRSVNSVNISRQM